MNIPNKKLLNGFEIPVFGIGTWLIGGTKVRNAENNDKDDIQSIKNALDLGISLIDTAENYAEGWAEKLTGEAIKGFDRKKLFITTKVDKTHLKHIDILNAAKASLERLQTDYLDLYLIHSPNPEIPLKETMEAMDELQSEGIIKNIGVSNFSVTTLKEAQSYSKNKIVVNQVYYNLLNRESEKDLLKFCQENDIILEAYRPLEKGRVLTGKIDLLQRLAEKYQKTPAQIALNWLISQKNVITISKISQKNHLEENLGAVGWEMDSKDVELLRDEFPGRNEKSEDFPLR